MIGRGTSASGPSKCHHSPEYTVRPPADMAARSRARAVCADGETPVVAKAVASGVKESKSVPMSTRQWSDSRRSAGQSVVLIASVTSTERPDSWLREYGPGAATQAGFGTFSNILRCTECGR